MKVPQFVPFIDSAEYLAIKDCFESKWITEGPKAKEFNKKLCKLLGSKYGVFAPNGTLALYLGLRAIGIGADDEVIVPDSTFIASANAVEMVGAKPVFVDVKKEDFQISVEDCHRVLSQKTKAIMPVHLYGMAANMTEVMRFASDHNLMVIEDAAQSLAVTWQDQLCGTFGDIGCFSFFADKTITVGEGGFVVTNNETIYEKLLYLRNQGRIERGTFIHPKIGYNFRITDIQAAVGLVQLQRLKEIVARKKAVLEIYQEELDSVKEVRFLLPHSDSGYIPFRVVILCEKAHELMDYLSDKEIEPRTFFYPLHQQPYYKYLKSDDKYFPNAIYGYDHGICLPSFPALTLSQIVYVRNAIKNFYR